MYMCTVYVGSVMSLLAFGFFASYGRWALFGQCFLNDCVVFLPGRLL